MRQGTGGPRNIRGDFNTLQSEIYGLQCRPAFLIQRNSAQYAIALPRVNNRKGLSGKWLGCGKPLTLALSPKGRGNWRRTDSARGVQCGSRTPFRRYSVLLVRSPRPGFGRKLRRDTRGSHVPDCGTGSGSATKQEEEVRGQRSEVRSQRSEVRGQETGCRKVPSPNSR